MYLFKEPVIVVPPDPPVTPARAQEIYGYCASRKTETEIFTEGLASFEELAIVWNEINAIEAEIISKMSGTFVIDEGPPVVYFEVQNRNKLETSLSSDILDTDLIVADLILYCPTYDSERKYADFKDYFDSLPLDAVAMRPKGK